MMISFCLNLSALLAMIIREIERAYARRQLDGRYWPAISCRSIKEPPDTTLTPDENWRRFHGTMPILLRDSQCHHHAATRQYQAAMLLLRLPPMKVAISPLNIAAGNRRSNAGEKLFALS